MRRWLATVVLCLVAVPVWADLRAEMVASGFARPIAFVQDPTNRQVFFVVEQGGRIRTLVNGVVAADFLDLTPFIVSNDERGLLGLAFAPDYAISRRFFVNFTNLAGHTVIARFERSAADPLAADPATRFDLVWPGGNAFIVQPFENHKGGNILFGPDGFLYIGMGDGGAGNDPQHRAQNPQSLLGKMLRIDVSVLDSDPEGYDIPPGNPFSLTLGVLAEIWSFGLRNPWRWSFDNPALGGTGAMLIGDVGQSAFEEISFEPPATGGRNYGWRNREGAHPTPGVPASPGPYLGAGPLIDPIFEYGRTVGTTVTGGVVYRGRALGDFYVGRYFFADFGSSRIWSFALVVDLGTGTATATDLIEHTAALGAAAENVSSFGVDADGEMYLVSYGGTISLVVNELTTNGSFALGLDGWATWGAPNPGDFVGDASSGVMQFFRQPAAVGTTNQAVIFQPTGAVIPANMPITASLRLGNSSTARKRVAVLVHNLSFNDLFVCSFWIPAGAPLRLYQVRTHTTVPWTNATISVYAATEGQDGGFYLLDDVTLRMDAAGSTTVTTCADPDAPDPIASGPGPEILSNGDFSSGQVPWTVFGQINFRLFGGVFEFVRPAGDPAGVVYQETNVSVPSRSIVTARFDLGNSSTVRKRVTVLLRDRDFSDLAACTFWLPAGQALMTYEIRAFATRAWVQASLSVYAATVGLEPWIRLDNVSLRPTPSQLIAGTDCLEPGAVGPIAHLRFGRAPVR